MARRSTSPRICEDCGTKVSGKYRRRRCENCYRAVLRREKGIPTAKERRANYNPKSYLFGSTVAGPDGCVIFTGPSRGRGYGALQGADGRRVSAHRLAYELMVGPIPDGMDIDHQCHNRSLTCEGGPMCRHRRCVNPFHLEPATPKENTRRAAARPASRVGRYRSDRGNASCRNGHERTEENVIWEKRLSAPGGRVRRCRQCLKNQQASARKLRRQAA
ncbi:HNH endonuclease signature motif containing protein [Streptomyces sp. NPDC093223]|uniref:HNH endonuclease signature motif containing protein n=1 Tax=Streptomyces sp. NPDC093223 TaxID=3366033 RepID=UPI00382DB448